jgi:hypothetical protein
MCLTQSHIGETMFPWIWFWCPTYNYPRSGAVAQKIEPDTNWFFSAIPSSAGNAAIEAQAFHIASYGRQLGLISEVLLHLADANAIDPASAKESLVRLKTIHQQIDALKTDDAARTADALITELRHLQDASPEHYERVRSCMS